MFEFSGSKEALSHIELKFTLCPQKKEEEDLAHLHPHKRQNHPHPHKHRDRLRKLHHLPHRLVSISCLIRTIFNQTL